ncbi:MarR family transcriptional regulator [Cryobacterium sp. Sr8]|uniref:MarR family winged helix-turn-helix transcriptional regulator n=1 Tax=Cryobacterium sp. Sr8 TaxID=1259203 RepID=UPI00106D94F9|nr:MarR family transcriptional regulator [Cryobacterium sp. Sr8]TFD77883.1 MarR family transcriptional regulator [Cryobacterium sp. Sr8]
MPERKEPEEPSASFWYRADDDEIVRAMRVLESLRRFRAADSAMRHRTQAEMDMNETDLLAIRHLIAAEARGSAVGPKDLSAVLGISSAATAKLLSRLVESGHIRREPHPSDRRAQLLHATPGAHREVRATLSAMHGRMLDVAEGLSVAQQKAVIHFLDTLSLAVSAAVVTPRTPGRGPAPTLER